MSSYETALDAYTVEYKYLDITISNKISAYEDKVDALNDKIDNYSDMMSDYNDEMTDCKSNYDDYKADFEEIYETTIKTQLQKIESLKTDIGNANILL